MAATATSELGNKMIRSLVMSLPSLAVTNNPELESKHYLLACNVNALVAATMNREPESKIFRSPAMSTPSWL